MSVNWAKDVNEYLKSLGFIMDASWVAYDRPYDNTLGWPLKFPQVSPDTNLIIMHFPDFITPRDGKILELEKIEKHFGKLCNRVLVTHWTHDLARYYQGPINLIEWNSHEYEIIHNLRLRQHEWRSGFVPRTQHHWQCLNGTFRPHRNKVRSYLQKTGWNNGTISWGMEVVLTEKPYNQYWGGTNEDNFIDLQKIYQRSSVNIVTETQYVECPGIISEKTYMALLAAQIPIMIGYKGIIDDCEALGFDMFRDLVDTSYDHLNDDIRWHQALELNQGLIRGDVDLTPYHDRMFAQQEFIINKWPEIAWAKFQQRAQELAVRLL